MKRLVALFALLFATTGWTMSIDADDPEPPKAVKLMLYMHDQNEGKPGTYQLTIRNVTSGSTTTATKSTASDDNKLEVTVLARMGDLLRISASAVPYNGLDGQTDVTVNASEIDDIIIMLEGPEPPADTPPAP